VDPALWLYNLATGAVGGLLPVAWLGLGLAGRWAQVRPRLGLYTDLAGPGLGPRVWLQAVSVGEVAVARAVAEELWRLAPGVNLTVTSTTSKGLETARRGLGERAAVAAFPLDLPWAVWAAARRIRPQVYASLETEIWPGLLTALGGVGATCLMLNGRLSPRSFPRYQKARPLVKAALQRFATLSMIGQADAQRIIALGAEPARVRVDGNAKYAGLLGRARVEDLPELKALLALGESPLLVAGSARTGEEAPVLAAFAAVRERHPTAVLAVAPRHVERAGNWLAACQALGLAAQRFSALTPQSPRRTETGVVVVDVMGRLMALYGLCRAAFLGASLVAKGGQNPMEAAAWGAPSFWGPSMEDFLDAAQALVEAGAGSRVDDAAGLARGWLAALDEPETAQDRGGRGREVVARWSGAAVKAAELILEHLDRRGALS
jgi:3-deoxy-D-manno-octulosonic-acid transferase